MKRKISVADQVYSNIYPRPSEADPQNWGQHLSRNIVAEVRLETHRFYGSLDTIEAKYPGLNYTYAPHIKRLSYWPHHLRLFQAFREIGSTNQEILALCRWEGTLWARQRYEQDEGIKVPDTTGSDIKPWRPRSGIESQQQRPQDQTKRLTTLHVRQIRQQTPHRNPQSSGRHGPRILSATTLPLQLQATSSTEEARVTSDAPTEPAQEQQIGRDVEMHDDEDTDTSPDHQDGQESNGLPASETLRRMQILAHARERGEMLPAMDPDFEQYFKDCVDDDEAGALSDMSSTYQAAQTVVSVMSTVAQTQTMASVAESSSNASRAESNRVPNVDVV
jgi:hypothetical protein